MNPGQKSSATILIPCFNEAAFIEQAVSSLIDEFVKENCEILIVDGLSTDGTRKRIQSLIQHGYPVRLLDNKKKYQVHGLNIGIREARGDIIIRADAHSVYPKNYVKRCMELLEKTGADNVGGVMVPKGISPVQKAIALALQHPAGVGNARFHLGNFSGSVDTVYLGAFRKSVFDRVGLYDENLRTNEDAEINMRITKSGGRVYLDSTLRVDYTPRNSLKDLARQYFFYGQGRSYTTLKHRQITSWRQAAPVILVPLLLSSFALGLFYPVLFGFPCLYILSLLLIGLAAFPKRTISWAIRFRLWIVFMVMHIFWGLGFWTHLIRALGKSLKRFSE